MFLYQLYVVVVVVVVVVAVDCSNGQAQGNHRTVGDTNNHNLAIILEKKVTFVKCYQFCRTT